MRKSKMSITVSGCICVFFISALILLPTKQVRAETVKYNYTTQMHKSEWVPIPDEKGHITGVFERRGVAIFEDEIAELTIRGTFEKKKGKISFQAYSQTTFKDGSTVLQKVQGSHEPPPGEELSVYEGKGEYIGGTGRFEGIKGTIIFTGRTITPSTKDETKGDNWIEVTGTYTLPKK